MKTHEQSRSSTGPRRRRWLPVAAAAAVLTMTVTACGSGSGGSASGGTTITYASWDAADEATRDSSLALVKKFEAEHPDIHVKVTPIPFTDFEQKVLLEAQSGSAPDVIQTQGSYTADFVAAKALAPLDSYAGGDYLTDVAPAVSNVGKVDGKLYAVPWAVQPVGLWYDRDLLTQAGLDPNKPPTTIDELLTALRQIKKAEPDVIPIGLDSTSRVFGLDVSWPWMQAFGADPLADGKANADTPEFKQYLQFMRTLAKEKLTEVNQKIGYYRPLAAQNQVAFTWDQPIFEATVKSAAQGGVSGFDKTWGVTTLPTQSGGQSYSVAEDHDLAISASAKDKKAAWTFIDWMTRNQTALDSVVNDKGSLPPTNKPPAAIEQTVTADSALVSFRDKVVPTVTNPPWGPDYGKAYAPIMAGVQEAMTTNDSIDDVAAKVQSGLESVLK